MKPERWQQVEALFHGALRHELPQRAAFLDRACGEDQALRREVASLLAAEPQAGDFLAAGARQGAAKMLAEAKPLWLVGQQLDHLMRPGCLKAAAPNLPSLFRS